MALPKTCATCGGIGAQGANICIDCMGSGAAEIAGVPRFLKEYIIDIEDKLNDIKTKTDNLPADTATVFNDILNKLNDIADAIEGLE